MEGLVLLLSSQEKLQHFLKRRKHSTLSTLLIILLLPPTRSPDQNINAPPKKRNVPIFGISLLGLLKTGPIFSAYLWKQCKVCWDPFWWVNLLTKATFFCLNMFFDQEPHVFCWTRKCQVDTLSSNSHPTKVKFNAPTLWKAFFVKCPTPWVQKMVKWYAQGRGDVEGLNWLGHQLNM